MKVLMFGWEFPPHISGGLGTASFGLTKGLAQFDDIEVLFVVPKVYGDEDDTAVEKIIGANEITIKRKHVNIHKTDKQIDISEVRSNLIPYSDPEEFWQLTQQRLSASTRFVQTDAQGKFRLPENMAPTFMKKLPITPLLQNTLVVNTNLMSFMPTIGWHTLPE